MPTKQPEVPPQVCVPHERIHSGTHADRHVWLYCVFTSVADQQKERQVPPQMCVYQPIQAKATESSVFTCA